MNYNNNRYATSWPTRVSYSIFPPYRLHTIHTNCSIIVFFFFCAITSRNFHVQSSSNIINDGYRCRVAVTKIPVNVPINFNYNKQQTRSWRCRCRVVGGLIACSCCLSGRRMRTISRAVDQSRVADVTEVSGRNVSPVRTRTREK